MTPETSHASRALLALPISLQGKPYLAMLILACANRVQALEDRAHEVINAFVLDDAEGEALAILGRFVGQPNYGFDDDDYRRLVKARVRINLSNGTRDDILEVVRYFFAGDVTLEQDAVAHLELTMAGDPVDRETFLIAIRDAKGHGIGLRWVHDGELYWAGSDADTENLWGDDLFGSEEV